MIKLILLFASIISNPHPEDAMTVANFFFSDEPDAYRQLCVFEQTKGQNEKEIIAWGWEMSEVVIRCIEIKYGELLDNKGEIFTMWDLWRLNPKTTFISSGLVCGIKYECETERKIIFKKWHPF